MFIGRVSYQEFAPVWPSMADERWATDLHTYYRVDPYWR